MMKLGNMRQVQLCYACFITCINVIALYLADPFQENISHIANVNLHLPFVFLWASSFSIYLILYTPRFMKVCGYTSILGRMLFYLSCIMMVVSILIPYLPDTFPILADVHIQVSSLATFGYVLIFFHMLYKGYFYNPSYIQKILPFYLCIVGSCAMLYILLGCVSTILEVIFVISMSWFLYSKKTTSVD